MNTIKHTPSPWKFFRASEQSGTSNSLILMQRETRQHLVYATEADGMGDAGSANLRLMEAAPDLLAALIELEAHADVLQSMLVGSASAKVFESMKRARTVIAKATNSQPD